MRSKSPFVSDRDTGLFFWRTGADDDEVQLSTHAHPLLPFPCAKHRWWSDKPCIVCREKKSVTWSFKKRVNHVRQIAESRPENQ